MMRCPSCQDDYEPHVRRCGDCGVELVPEGTPAVPPPPDARLGRFHPVVADALLPLLSRRHIAHETVTRDAAVEILVEREWRDDLRSELTLTWGDILRGLPEERATEIRGLSGEQPGWFDPPRGGWVDRRGRLVVDTGEDEEADAARTLGPTLAVLGGVVLLLSWYASLGAGPVVAGVGLVMIGLLLPR